METIMNQLTDVVGPNLPKLAWALGILIVGWLVALVLAAGVKSALRRTTLDNRLAVWIAGEGGAERMDVEGWTSKAVYYLIMLFVLVGFFQTLGLTLITEPVTEMLNSVFGFLPRLLAAGVLLGVAWILATGVRLILIRALSAARLDERFGDEAGLGDEKHVPLAKSLADSVYWLIFLLFLPAVLNALALEGLLRPVQSMLDKVVGFLPNVVTAGLILAAGWFLARIVQRIVTNLLAAMGIDSLSERTGLSQALGKQQLSGLVGLVVYVLIFIPVLIAALSALRLEAITRPASNMLNTILEAIPAVFAAVLVLTIAYLVGRLVAGLIANLLARAGFNTILAKLGIGQELNEGPRAPSAIMGSLVLVAIMLFATAEAADLLGFAALSAMVSDFLVFAGHIILGLIIFGIGLYLANFASRNLMAGGKPQARLLAFAARTAILILAGAMALRQMGLANEIISLAFGLVVGAVAIAVAIAFGLGGREVAARELNTWVQSLRSPSPPDRP